MEKLHFPLHSGNRYVKNHFCLKIKQTILIHHTKYILQIILPKFWILEFLEISTLLNHSVTTDYSAEIKLTSIDRCKYSITTERRSDFRPIYCLTRQMEGADPRPDCAILAV